MTAFAGLRGTGDFGTDERPKNFRELILKVNPNGDAPIFALMAKMSSESVDDPEFAWWEEALDVPRVVTTGSFVTATTSLTLQAEGTAGTHGSGLDLVAGDLLMVELAIADNTHVREIVEVASVTDATNITVVRGRAGTTAVSYNTAAIYMTKIGNVFAEGEGSPNVSSRNPTKKYNYCQIYKTAYEITNTAKKTRFRTGDPLKNDRNRKMFDHSAAIEMSLLFGRRYEEATSSANGKPRRFTGGLLDANIGLGTTRFATAPTENAFLDAIEPHFQQNAGSGVNDERILFAGNGFLNAINKKFKDSNSSRIINNGVFTQYGMRLQRITLPFGEVAIKTHPLLTRHARYTNSAIMIHGSLLKLRELRPTTAQDNIQGNDEDTQKGQWLSEIGFEIHHAGLMRHLHISDPTVA